MAYLDGSSPKLTRNQKLVHDRLEAAGRALSAYELLDLLRVEGLRAPAQVYRALDKLADFGLIHRLESRNAYIACNRDGHAAHDTAFAICEQCGTVSEFDTAQASAVLRGWAADNGFEIEQTTIELRGRCAACLAS